MKIIILKNEGQDNQSHDVGELSEIVSQEAGNGITLKDDKLFAEGGFKVTASSGAPDTTNTADMPTKMAGKARTLILGAPDVWTEVQHEGKTYLMPLYEKV